MELFENFVDGSCYKLVWLMQLFDIQVEKRKKEEKNMLIMVEKRVSTLLILVFFFAHFVSFLFYLIF